MYRLPDGSGFFTGIVGPREPGIINFLKYRKVGCARMWLFKWRMFWSVLEISRIPGQGPPMNYWQAFWCAMRLP